MVPAAPFPATVVPFSCPDENNCTRLFPQSATYKIKLRVIKIPRGEFSMSELEPIEPFPAASVVAFELMFIDRLITL